MAVSVVRTSFSDRTSGTSKTFSIDATGGNMLAVVVNTYDDGSDTDGEVTGITYAGVAMNEAVQSQGISGTRNWSHVYYLANPTTGTNNIVISLNGNTDGIVAGAVLLTSASTTALDNASGSTDTGTTSSLELTTTNANTIMVGGSQSEVNAYGSQGASQSSIGQGDSNFVWHSYKSLTSSGANSMTFTSSGSDRHCWSSAAFYEVTVTTTKHLLGLLGIGA